MSHPKPLLASPWCPIFNESARGWSGKRHRAGVDFLFAGKTDTPVSAIREVSTVVSAYRYLGLGSFVGVDYPVSAVTPPYQHAGTGDAGGTVRSQESRNAAIPNFLQGESDGTTRLGLTSFFQFP